MKSNTLKLLDWQDVEGSWIFSPRHPKGVVHFLGGAFVAVAPHVTYRMLLEFLGAQGYAVIATPFINTFDHRDIAQQVLEQFEWALMGLKKTVLRGKTVPIYGIGHSMGCKLHLLIGSLFDVERSGNVLISFNNFPVRRSIPFIEPVAVAADIEFIPSPIATTHLIRTQYQVPENLLIRFRNDDIDQTLELSHILHQQFPEQTTTRLLSGNHLTPLSQDVLNWTPSVAYSPLDAIGQWVKQTVYQDLQVLQKVIHSWLESSWRDREAIRNKNY